MSSPTARASSAALFEPVEAAPLASCGGLSASSASTIGIGRRLRRRLEGWHVGRRPRRRMTCNARDPPGGSPAMATNNLEPLLREAERRAVLAVLRGHPEWTLGHVFSHLEQNGPRAPLLRDLTLGELLEDPRLDQVTRATDGGPPVDRKRRAEAKRLTGERFDECVRAVLDEAKGASVGAAYLRARVGGPRW